jgi:hypothetical protein
MNDFENHFRAYGEAMIATAEGQRQISQAIAAALGKGFRRLGKLFVKALSRTPTTGFPSL